ncbi:hypothetical protein XENTR_v10000261 [Xenopus tropicalis]|nr:hypothetical protein XENTR_v10000261 [Xenopus tropicalis]
MEDQYNSTYPTYFNLNYNPLYSNYNNVAEGQDGYTIQQFVPAGAPLYQPQVPQTLPFYAYDIYGRLYTVDIQRYSVPVESSNYMGTTAHSSALHLGNQFQQTSEQGANYMQISNADINMQQHSTESSEQNKAFSDGPSMSLSTEEPIKLSPKLPDDSKVNAVSEKKTKKRKRKTTDPADEGLAKKQCSKLQQKLFESVNTFHALGKKPALTSQIREAKEQTQNQRPKPASPKRGQVQTNSRNQQRLNHPLTGVQKRAAPSSSTTAQNIQFETKIMKSPPRREEIPLPPEDREALKRKAQQEREKACQYTAKGRVRFFKQRQRDMDISLYYGYLP